MLTEKEIIEIQDGMKYCRENKTGAVEALMVIQHNRGYVSDEALQELSKFLDLSCAELDSIATFYNLILRKTVGKYVIRVCDSVSCFLTGGEKVADYLKEKLNIDFGGTSKDGLFTLLPTVCLGHCDQGPVMLVNSNIITNLTKEKIDTMISQAKEFQD